MTLELKLPLRLEDPTLGGSDPIDGVTVVNPGFSGAGSTVPPRNPHIEVTNFTADFQEIDVFGRILKRIFAEIPKFKLLLVQSPAESFTIFYPFVWFSFLATFSHLTTFHKFLL